jgi:hypothetical protein
MAHCIQAIVAPTATADAVSVAWPELPRLDRNNGFSIFPVSAELIDQRIAPDSTPTSTGDEFQLLTAAFQRQLCLMSLKGILAYVETEYFGGWGGQGALVYKNGEEVMSPEWAESGTINGALKLIGVPRSLLADRFSAISLDKVRSNDDLLDLITGQASDNA